MIASTIATLIALSLPSQGTGISLSNTRVTYGELGASRPDNKFLPGDIFFVSFDIDGITIDPEGKVKYSMGMEVLDAKGVSIFKQAPVDREDFVPLGGNKLPARAFFSVAVDQEPGVYTCKVTVTDRGAKTEPKVLEHKFEVLKKDFGIVQLFTSVDPEGKFPSSTTGIVGQSLFVQFALVGFEREAVRKQPKIEIEMTVYDEKTTLPKPVSVTIDKDVPEKDLGIPLRFTLPMNRAGGYLVELKATDLLSKKVAKVYLPVRVIAPN